MQGVENLSELLDATQPGSRLQVATGVRTMCRHRRWLWWLWAVKLFPSVAQRRSPSPRRPRPREQRFSPLALWPLESREAAGALLSLAPALAADDDPPTLLPDSTPPYIAQFDMQCAPASDGSNGDDVPVAPADTDTRLPIEPDVSESATPALFAFSTSLTLGAPDPLGDLTQAPSGDSLHGLPPLPTPGMDGGVGGSAAPSFTPAPPPPGGYLSTPLLPAGVNNALLGALFGSNPPAPPAAQPTAPQAAAAPPHLATATPAPAAATPPHASHGPASPAGPVPHDPLYVLDVRDGLIVPANTPVNDFSTWSADLWAQVSGAAVTSYSWDTSQAPDATSVSGATTAHLQFTWASFTGATRSDTITLTTTNSDNTHQTFTLNYQVASTTSPGYASQPPTTSSTWQTVITPDEVMPDQASVASGPYAQLGLWSGNVQTTYALPAYNPGVAPLSLLYNSATAVPDPVWVVHWQLPTSGALPSTVTATLTLAGTTAQATTYITDGRPGYPILNPGDYLEIALVGTNAYSLSTGRYGWNITVVPSSGSSNSYNGSVDVVNQAHGPLGAGWSLSNVSQVVSATGGVILVQPGGTSLWFANGQQSGTYVTPAGDFSTLVQNGNGTWTRTLPDGTAVNFNTSGYQTSIVDRVGNTTTFNRNGANLLTSITDMNGQVTNLAYNGSNQVTSITDPANRSTTLALSSNQTTSITGPDSKQWKYSYSSNNLLTNLTDPRNNISTFNYDTATQVTGTTQPDGSVQQLTPVQKVGLALPSSGPPPPGGGNNGTAPGLVGAAVASYQVGSGTQPIWTTGLDWLGFGRPVTPADPLLDSGVWPRDVNGLAWLAADPLGRATRSFFDNKGNTTKIVLPDASVGQYTYNAFSEVSQYTDPTGALWTYNYDSLGNLTQAVDPLSHASNYTYTSKGSVSTITDALGHTYTINYYSYNRPTSIVDPLTHTATMGYDSASDVTVATDVRNFTGTYGYDSMGRVTQETLPVSQGVNAIWSLGYDAVGNLTSLTDPLSHALTYGFDAMNRQTKVTDALNHSTSYGFDSNSNLTSVTNALNKSWNYVFDGANRLVRETDPLLDMTTIGYDAASQVTLIKDPLNRQWQYTYTAVGLRSSVTDPTGDVVSFGYDAAQYQTARTESASGFAAHTWTEGYDAAHRLTASTDALGNQTTYGFDNANNRTSVTDALHHALTYGYDALNRMTSRTDALSEQTTIGYDNGGNATAVTDPLHRTSTYSFDGQGRMLTATDPNGGLVSYNYDLAGRLTALTDPVNNKTQYGYDNANNLTSMTDALNNAATYGYDAANERTAATDRNGRQRTFGYDDAMRQTSETWVGGSYTATYNYDAASELTKATDASSQYFYSYDNAGRLKQVDNNGTTGVPRVLLTYNYDGYGNRTSLSDSLGGSISYTYDGDHRLTNLSTPVTGGNANLAFGYDAASRVTAVTRTSPSGDSITSAFGYDNVDRLTSILHKDSTSSTTLASFNYGYDGASQLTSYSVLEGNLTYGYDPAGQLTQVSGARNETYSYDKNGNRTMTGYSTGTGNELLNDGTYSYSYDKEGNLTGQTQISGGQTTSYTYDYRNRLVEAVVSSSTGLVLNDEKFTYDVNDNRIGVTLNGVQQLGTVYDGQNPYIDFNGSGQVTERYLTDPTGLDQFYARVSSSGTVNWYLTDNLGSIRQIVGTNGSVLDQLTYGTFGAVISESNSANGDRFKYAGGERDSILGSVRFDARYYLPSSGRWVSQDPLGLRPDSNPYRYVENHPLQSIDPSGLQTRAATSAGEDGWGSFLNGAAAAGVAATASGLSKIYIVGIPIGGVGWQVWLGMLLPPPYYHYVVVVEKSNGQFDTYSYIGDRLYNDAADRAWVSLGRTPLGELPFPVSGPKRMTPIYTVPQQYVITGSSMNNVPVMRLGVGPAGLSPG
jgi:RHS repeat-associated protein